MSSTPSTLDTTTFRHLVLESLEDIVGNTSGGEGGLVTISPSVGGLTSYSGTVITGGVSQIVIPAGAISKYLEIQNTGVSVLYLAFGATATITNGFQISPNGGSFVMETSYLANTSINLLGGITGQPFVIWAA